MKKYSKPVKCDSRGQVVIPRDIRSDLAVSEGTGFFLYSIPGEGLLLKKINYSNIDYNDPVISEIDEKSDKIGVKKTNLKKSIERYEKKKEGNLELI